MPAVLNACHLGATRYAEGLQIQEALVRARAAGETGDWLLFPDHPPVLTVGRSPSEGSVIASTDALRAAGIEIHEVSRGGDVTWHGPGQLVGYPIIDLNLVGRDLHRYMRALDASLIDVLGEWEIEAVAVPGRTGVWTGGAKIASIGIAVRRWVSYHGFALNVAPDLGHFELIHPCGLRGIQMASMAAVRGPGNVSLSEVRTRTAANLAGRLGFDRVDWTEADALRRVASTGFAA